MLIRHGKTFNLGALLAITFVVVEALIFSPMFGNGKNGLQYSDELFNKLSKGSSYFIPGLTKDIQPLIGKQVSFTVKLEKPEQVEQAVKILIADGAQVGAQGNQIKVSTDLGQLLTQVLKDSDAMYHNNGAEISSRYGIDERDEMVLMWTVLNKSIKELQKDKKIDEANQISEVMKKGMEPAFNYYKIEPQQVSDKAFTMTALLVFYVAYTMWWGYAIFYMFDGLGLSMKKAKVKKEA